MGLRATRPLSGLKSSFSTFLLGACEALCSGSCLKRAWRHCGDQHREQKMSVLLSFCLLVLLAFVLVCFDVFPLVEFRWGAVCKTGRTVQQTKGGCVQNHGGLCTKKWLGACAKPRGAVQNQGSVQNPTAMYKTGGGHVQTRRQSDSQTASQSVGFRLQKQRQSHSQTVSQLPASERQSDG